MDKKFLITSGNKSAIVHAEVDEGGTFQADDIPGKDDGNYLAGVEKAYELNDDLEPVSCYEISIADDDSISLTLLSSLPTGTVDLVNDHLTRYITVWA